MIEVRGLCKRFGKVDALSYLNLELDIGKSYAIIGPNGSGKTTLIKSLLGMVIPQEGVIEIDGRPIAGEYQYRENIGYMPQTGRYPEHLSVGQLLEMMRDLRKNSTYDEELIHAFEIPSFYNKRIYTLSGGMRQKVSAALAFLFSPSILILDEPTAGLDPFAVEVLKDKINRLRDENHLFLITSHIMSDLEELASDVVYLEQGTLKHAGSIDELRLMTGEKRLGRAIVHMLQGDNENVGV